MGMIFRNKNLIKNSSKIIRKIPMVIKATAIGKRDMLTGQKRNKATSVSFSNKKSRKWQQLNLQTTKIYWPEEKRFVRIRVSARTIRTIEKEGISALAKTAGINLKSWLLTMC